MTTRTFRGQSNQNPKYATIEAHKVDNIAAVSCKYQNLLL